MNRQVIKKLILLLIIIVSPWLVTDCRGDEPVEEVYIQRCAGCHGSDGYPQRPNTPDFTDPEVQKKISDEEMYTIISEGKPPRMPSFKEKLEEPQMRALVKHIRTFAQNDKKE